MEHDQMSVRILDAQDKPLNDGEIRMLAEIELHPKVQEWDTGAPTKDIEEMYRLFKKFFEELPKNEDQIFLVAKAAKRVVGFVGIHRMSRLPHIGQVGVIVHPDYQSRGIGTQLLMAAIESARNKGFERLEADTLAHNKPMIKLVKKVGFKFEGVRKMRIKRSGKYLDEALFAMTPH